MYGHKFEVFVNQLMELVLPTRKRDRMIKHMVPDSLFSHLFVQDQNGITTFFEYRDPMIKNLIHAMKFRSNTRVAALFGIALRDILLEEIAFKTLLGEGDQLLVIPIPASPERLDERGYNQVEWIARAFISASSTNALQICTGALLKKAGIPPQTSIRKRQERIQNMRHAFYVQNRVELSDRSIILLDDVTTTGATLLEAKDALLASGARHVNPIAIAH